MRSFMPLILLFVFAVFCTYVLSRLLLFLGNRWITGYSRIFLAHAASLAICVGAYGL